mmetsp:Transcript_49260/g.104740  ORF Transcript_49260/g.104740 Transcript_49260/m.104740 type:complete len:100 (-) Transcript_49260:38-337(-)
MTIRLRMTTLYMTTILMTTVVDQVEFEDDYQVNDFEQATRKTRSRMTSTSLTWRAAKTRETLRRITITEEYRHQIQALPRGRPQGGGLAQHLVTSTNSK